MEVTTKRYNGPPRQSVRRKYPTKGLILAILVLLLPISLYIYLALNKEPSDPRIIDQKVFSTVVVSESENKSSVNWPVSGMAAVGSLDEGLYELKSGVDSQVPIGSIAKLITALVILDKEPLSLGEQGWSYTISQDDIDIYTSYIAKLGSVMPVQYGQELTQYQMLQALLLPSANNIADSMVIKTFGSVDSYTVSANQYLKEHGLYNTEVADASGFSPQTKSSPSDLIKLGQMALINPVISQIASQKSANIPGSGIVNNTNQLLASDNVVGLKTGNTDEAGMCLLFAFKHGPDLSETAISVIMAQQTWQDLYKQAALLRESVLENFRLMELVPAKTVVANLESEWGDLSNVLADQSIAVYGWKSKSYEVEITYDDVRLPARSGQVIGYANIKGDDKRVALVLENTLAKPSHLWSLFNYW